MNYEIKYLKLFYTNKYALIFKSNYLESTSISFPYLKQYIII